jgi:ABC-type branched-subunit amino acid transport system substrate-binding protein
MRRSAALGLVVGVLLAGCASDDDDNDGATPTSGGAATEPATVSTSAATTTTSGPATAGTTATTAPVELTASFRGVTADTIRVGISYPDLEAIRNVVQLDHGDYEAAYRALIDDVNASGGVLGRTIEPVFAAVNPIGTAPADEACVRLTEDEEVFAVLGAFQGDAPLCYVEQHETALVGGTMNDELLGRAAAPWFAAEPNASTIASDLVQAYVDDDVFADATVAVAGSVADQTVVEAAAAQLEDAGIDVAETAILEDFGGDTVAADQAVAVFAQRFEAAGVDTVLVVADGFLPIATGLAKTPYRARLVATSINSVRSYVSDDAANDLSLLDGLVVGSVDPGYPAGWDDPELQDCVSIIEEATGTTIIDPDPGIDHPDGEPENSVSARAACQYVRLFAAIAAAAGPELTNDTFRAAGESLGEHPVAGIGTGNYTADTPDGGFPIYLFRYDPDRQDIFPDPEPIDVD